MMHLMTELDSLASEAKRKLTCLPPFSKVVPRSLYHYTTAEGLIGILSTGQIWATDMDYLNDASEYSYAKAPMDHALAKQKPINSDLERFRNVLRYNPRELWGFYVTCFCEKGDLLSQWRAYGNNGTGYAIEMDASFFSALSSGSEEMLFGPVEYKISEQRKLLASIFEQIDPEMRTDLLKTIYDRRFDRELTELRDGGLTDSQALRRIEREGLGWTGFDGYFPTIEKFFSVYIQLSFGRAFLKSRLFAEEKEWRIIKTAPRNSKSDLRFRAKNGMMIPYVCIDLRACNAQLPVTRVMIGPTLHTEQARKSLEEFLVKSDLKHIEVVTSSIPLRL